MHLLAVQSGVIDDGSEAVDLRQEPGDVIVLSAADTELAALARARDGLDEGPSLRLANLMQLSHHMSVDVYVENTLAQAKLVVVRLLGGAAYWSYGIDQVAQRCRDNGIGLVVLPGDAKPDPELVGRSTLPRADCEALWRYLIEGGPQNAANFLRHAFHLIGEGEAPPAARPLVRAGLYWSGRTTPSLSEIKRHWTAGAPVAPIVFYRALLEAGNTAPVEALADALTAEGLNPLPIFVSSLKEAVSAATVRWLFAEAPPAVVLNATGFAVAGSGDNPLAEPNRPVLQVVFAGSSREGWLANPQGLSARDLAMNVVLPELDGRILSRAISFKSSAERHVATQCNIVTYRPEPDRVAFVARLAANWARLSTTPAAERKLAIVLANYPNRDGRIGNGVGYDTPASTVAILDALRGAGYSVSGYPDDGTALIKRLLEGPTNRSSTRSIDNSPTRLSLADYRAAFTVLPEEAQQQVTERWGAAEDDPFFRNGEFHLPVVTFDKVAVAIQPARGYNIDPKSTYHDPALVPPHGYFAFHIWLRDVFGAQAVIHNGKHGNLEWLPGKALALTPACYPEAALGPLPNIYPFIVNDPGEGSQAKRRTAAVIVDHLTPPLTRAESYGPLKDLEALVDEYYLASGLDARRMALLKREILDISRVSGLDVDAGIVNCPDDDEALQRLDAYICDLKEAQIRDGLHVLGSTPQGRLETDLLVALARVPRGLGEEGNDSLIRALAADLGLQGFDPLDCEMAAHWEGPRPQVLTEVLPHSWRTAGDTVERLEALAARLVEEGSHLMPGIDPGVQGAADRGEVSRMAETSPAMPEVVEREWKRTRAVLVELENVIRPALRASGPREISAVLAALDGRFVEPGPSGAPTRGRVDVLPTGRNFYSVDSRALPTPAAWRLGEASAAKLGERHLEETGNWPRSLGLSAWGTSNMRTGGDDIAQALALIGARPVWDTSSWRVTGFEIVPTAKLGRPRVDVTLRVSGFFRDAFPAQMDLFDSAIRAVGALDEDAADNPIAERMRAEAAELEASGVPGDEARRRAGYRIFGSKPGAYGAGLQALIDEKLWDSPCELAESYLSWGGYAYGAGAGGTAEHATFRRRLAGVEAVVQNQDNREHDLLDSDDYYQFEGGMTAAVEHLSGSRPTVYHNDHSRPERPVIRTLEEEIGRVMRSRVVNPKWIAGIMRHGYKGAFEIVATVDYMFAFAATTGAVKPHHFELAYDAFIANEEVRGFIGENNPAGLRELAERFQEAIDRGLWSPRSNSAPVELAGLTAGRTREGAA